MDHHRASEEAKGRGIRSVLAFAAFTLLLAGGTAAPLFWTERAGKAAFPFLLLCVPIILWLGFSACFVSLLRSAGRTSRFQRWMRKDSRYAYLAVMALALNTAVFLFAAHQGRAFWWPYAVLPLLMLLIGLFQPLAKRNAAFGVRNGWTRSSKTVWRKTQLFSGGVSAAVGIVLIPLCGFSSAPISAIGLAVGGFALIAVCSTLGSYRCFRRYGPAAEKRG